jgi:hypothetical protein
VKYYITTSGKRQYRILHQGMNCPLTIHADGFIEVDPATLRVFTRCKYCFS